MSAPSLRTPKSLARDVASQSGIRSKESSSPDVNHDRVTGPAVEVTASARGWMGVKVGDLIGGKYLLLRQIGEGGMGSVWAAVHQRLERQVAIKFLHHSQVDSKERSQRFAHEARSAARASNRYVVDVFDVGMTEIPVAGSPTASQSPHSGDHVHYMVQELLRGEELSSCIYEGPAWDVREVVRFMAQCLTGLDAVHRVGIVHRDIKPENIFVARDAEGPFPKLFDFGICHLQGVRASEPEMQAPARRGRSKVRAQSQAAARRVAANAITEGTPAYMAPEQLRGLVELDGRADLYSVGVVLYEWLSGRLPYEQTTPEDLCTHIAARSALPLARLRPELGDALSEVIARALSPEPGERFETAADMRVALLELESALPSAQSVVQKSVGSVPIGSKTESVLTSASSPFVVESEEDTAPSFIVPSSRRTWRVGALAAAAAAGLLGLWAVPHAQQVATHKAPAPVATPKLADDNSPHLAPFHPSEPVEARTVTALEPTVVQAAAVILPTEPTKVEADEVVAQHAPKAEPVVAAKSKLVRARPAPSVTARALPLPAKRGAPLGEVKMEFAAQSAVTVEVPVQERELTGLDMRRLGL